MFGISAFSQSPFASLGGTPVQVDLSGVSAQALLSDPTQVPISVDAEANDYSMDIFVRDATHPTQMAGR